MGWWVDEVVDGWNGGWMDWWEDGIEWLVDEVVGEWSGGWMEWWVDGLVGR